MEKVTTEPEELASLVASAKTQPAGKTRALVLRLLEGLHRYGTPAHRLEQAISHVSKELGLVVQVFSMPTGLFLSFEEGDEQQTYLLRVAKSELHLEKQCDLDELADAVIAGEVGVDDAQQQLQSIDARPNRYKGWLLLLAFAFCGVTVARIFGGGWKELIVSFGGGLLTGSTLWLAGKTENLGRIAPGLSSFLVAFYVTVVAVFVAPLAQAACHLSSVIVLIPGLSLTVAMTEISTHNLVSGTARFAGALEVLLQIGFGLALGTLLGQRLMGTAPTDPVIPLPPWSFWLALLGAACTFLALFQARPKDLLWIVVAAFVAMIGAKWGAALLGPRLGPFLGAFLVGLSGNLFARLFHRPASIMMLPGLLLLVPGSVGMNSISALLNKNTLVGMETAFTAMLVTISLVFGILMASLVLPPRRSL